MVGYGEFFVFLEMFYKPYMTKPFLTIIDNGIFVGCCAGHGGIIVSNAQHVENQNFLAI